MTPTEIQARAVRYVAALNRGDVTAGSERFVLVLNPSPRGRYDRVVRTLPDGTPAAIHAFIETATGHVLKPAGWKGPAKGVRYRLTDDASYAALLAAAAGPHAYAGGYLYADDAAAAR